MELRRAIEQTLLDWKKNPERMPLVVKGCRQCGKTYSVLKFARENYANVVYLNFFEKPEHAALFRGSLAVDDLVMMMGAYLGPSVKLEPGRTVLVLDEIQDCPEARTALKFLAIDGRFDVICTGSLLGVQGYGEAPRSIPVGYETIVEMHPLGFEEFLWANGVSDAVLATVRGHFENATPVPEALHARMRELFLQYAVVGGMPRVVREFLETRRMDRVLLRQRALLASYEEDMAKYARTEDKAKIRECFRSIPKQLAKDNKKFQYKVVRKGATGAAYEGSLQWIEDAGIIVRCHNVTAPELPLDGNAIPEIFKVYMRDCGLLVAMLEDGTQFDVLQGNLQTYKGAVFENLVADVWRKKGRKLYYFRRADSRLEVDFLVRRGGACVPVEVKATNGTAKSLKTLLKHEEKYRIREAFKLVDGNVGPAAPIRTVPHYMAMFI